MRLALFAALVISIHPVSRAQSDSQAQHVVLISVDGLRPEFYMDTSWPAPLMQQMAKEGAYSDGVRGVFPTVTYPSHTTILTGAKPSRHGIFYNSPFEPEGQTGRWYWEEELIQVPTLWDAVRAAGKQTGNVGWPVSVGAPVDYNIAEVWPLDRDVDRTTPLRETAHPEGFFEEIEREATGRLTSEKISMDYASREDHAGAMAAYILETYKPALLTVHIISVDHFEHVEGRDGPMVRRAVSAADNAIGQIVDAAQRAGILESTAFIVTGDHGFVDIHSRLAPNVWLAAAGLMEPTRDRGDWRATFHGSGAAAFLMLSDPSDTAAVDEVRRILEEQPESIKKLFRVVERDELDRIGSAADAALAIAPAPGVNITASATLPPLTAATGGTHGFYPDFEDIETGFIGWGAGIKEGAVVPEMGLEDIAPIVARLLDLEFDAPDGVLYPGVLSRR